MIEARSPLAVSDGASEPLSALRGLAYGGLALAFFHVVAAAVVRVAGGPAAGAAGLAIAGETSAWILGLLLAMMTVLALRHRRAAGVEGASGIIGALALAAALLIGIAAAGSGATPEADAGLAIARALLVAALALLVLRTGGLGASDVEPGSGRSRSVRGALASVGVAFVAVALGAFTARVPGAASACDGVLSCAVTTAAAGARHVHLAHQALALLLVGLTAVAAIGTFRRREPAPVQRAARMALGSVLLQIGVAMALVTEALPASLRSLHAATGMLVWLSLVTYASLAGRAAVGRAPVVVHHRPTHSSPGATRPRVTTAVRRAYSTPVAVPAMLATLAVEAMGVTTEPVHVDASDASGHGALERTASREPADVPATAHAGETVRVAVTPGSVAAVVGGHEQIAQPVVLFTAVSSSAVAEREHAVLAEAVLDEAILDDVVLVDPVIVDAVTVDAGIIDAGIVDAGIEDALTVDAGIIHDADLADHDDRRVTVAPDAAPEVVALPAPPRARRRPPTLAVLIARGADF